MNFDQNPLAKFAGRDVPPVDPDDLRKLWNFRRLRDASKALGMEAARQICSPGADVAVVGYRLMMLEMLFRLWASREPSMGKMEIDDAALVVAATFPMKGMPMGSIQNDLPFDAEGFLRQIAESRGR